MGLRGLPILARPDLAAELGFDGAAEAVGTVGVLALQVAARATTTS